MDHHVAEMVTADTPLAPALYTTQEVATLLRVSQRTVQDGPPATNAGKFTVAALAEN